MMPNRLRDPSFFFTIVPTKMIKLLFPPTVQKYFEINPYYVVVSLQKNFCSVTFHN